MLEETVSTKILAQKDLKQTLAEEEAETAKIEEQLLKLTRTGRQPGNGSFKKRKKKNRSFEGSSDEDGAGNSMVVPPDDDCGGKNDDDLLSLSPQTKDTYIEQCENIKHRALSAILSEGGDEESQYFEDSEAESEYQEEGSGVTLIEGKKSSKKKKSKKQEK